MFVQRFAENMISLLQSQAKHNYILKDRVIFKEFVKIPLKFEVRVSRKNFSKLN
jgi:hypothetical protein